MTDDNLRRSIRAVGLFHYFLGGIAASVGGLLLVVGLTKPDIRLVLVTAPVLAGVAGGLLLLGRDLRQFRPWARNVAIVTSCIAVTRPPVALILGAAFLYVLVRGRHLFRPGSGSDTAAGPAAPGSSGP